MKIDSKFLPSKKFLISLAIAISVILVTIVITFLKDGVYFSGKSKGIVEISESATFKAFKQLDTDEDNLPDWQETLYGTDPKKADTDDDGTNDEDEMKANRDPIKANTASKDQEPNDKIDPKIIEQVKKSEEDYEKLNDTEKFARNFMSQYLASQPADRQMTEEEKESLVNNMLSKIEIGVLSNNFSISDIKVSKILDKPDVIIGYLTNLTKVIERLTKNYVSSIELINKLDLNNLEDIKKLESNKKEFVSIANYLINTETPDISARESLDLSNCIYNLVELINQIMLVNSDPLKSVGGLQGYYSKYLEAINLSKIIVSDIKKNYYIK